MEYVKINYFKLYKRCKKIKSIKLVSKKIILKSGTIIWLNKNEHLHRINGPAKIFTSGREEWHINGLCYREGLPAIYSTVFDTKFWFKDGNLHRTDGPAIESTKWGNVWALEGVKYKFKEDWFVKLEQTQKSEIIWCINDWP